MRINPDLRWGLLLLTLCVKVSAQLALDPLAEARATLARGRIAQAESAVDAYLKLHPTAVEAHYLRAEILFRRKEAKGSLAEFTEGAKGRRPSSREFGMIASDYILLQDFADADKWFTEATVEAPGDPTYWYLLGRTKYKESQYEAALGSFEHALSLRPEYVEAENNRGLALSALGKKDAAIEAFRRAINWQGDAGTDAQPYLNLGTTLVEQNDLSGGVKLLTKAVTLFPSNPRMHEELGKAYIGVGDLVPAQRELEAAVALSPETSSLHFRLGQIYKKRKMTELADEEFAVCARLTGTHSSASTPNPYSPDLLEIK